MFKYVQLSTEFPIKHKHRADFSRNTLSAARIRARFRKVVFERRADSVTGCEPFCEVCCGVSEVRNSVKKLIDVELQRGLLLAATCAIAL